MEGKPVEHAKENKRKISEKERKRMEREKRAEERSGNHQMN